MTMTFLVGNIIIPYYSIQKSNPSETSVPSTAILDPSPWDVENPCLEVNIIS